MTTALREVAQSAIEYPDSDGEPMAENTLQFKWIVVIKEGLEALFRHHPDVFVAGDLLWYPVQGHPKIRAAPDAMVALSRPKGRRGSYRQWEEAGIAPQVVFEVLSPGKTKTEMAAKFAFYETYGVAEYYVYDPDDGTLLGWLRKNGHLEPIADMVGFVSPLLGIRFEPGEGPDNLTIVDPHGKIFLYSDLVEQLATGEQRADEERLEKEAERAEKEAERERAERYAAKLRSLGIEPD